MTIGMGDLAVGFLLAGFSALAGQGDYLSRLVILGTKGEK